MPGEGKTSCNGCDIPPKCHCEERSDEAIQETKFSIGKMNTKTELLTFGLRRFARNDKTSFTKTVNISTCVAPRNDKGEKSSLIRLCRAKQLSIVLREVDLGGCLSFNANKIETHPRPLPKHGGEKRAAFTLAEGATQVGICDNIRKSAFTLAEILITLAIIGVVATLTIPNLIANYEKRVTEVRIHKAYASFLQLIRLAQVDHGPFKTWDFIFSDDHAENTKIFSEKYILPYLKGATYCDGGFTEGECAPYVGCGGFSQNYKLADGTMLGICAYSSDPEIYLNISPRKDLDKFHSKFSFIVPKDSGKLIPNYYDPKYTREDYLNGIHIDDSGYNDGAGYDVACKRDDSFKYNSHTCTALIFVDRFKIKDDYPW